MGIHEKGHSVTRKMKSDGHVDTMQTMHNLNEDELVSFEEAWKGNARKNLPGLPAGFVTGGVMGSGSSGQHGQNIGGWALPSTERSNNQKGNLKPPQVGERTGNGRLPRNPGRIMKPGLNDGSGSTRHGTSSSNQMNRRF